MRFVCKIYKTAWCGLCYEQIRGRGRGHGKKVKIRGTSTLVGGPLDMGIERPRTASSGQTRDAECVLGALALAYPTLWEHLSLRVYTDGGPRVTSTLLLFTEDGLVKCCLSDRDQNASGWSAGASLEECLQSLEDRLVAGTLDWRARKQQPQRKGR